MKRAIIVHCWEGYPDYCWYQSTKKELEAIGFSVEVPTMPETNLPKLSLWLPKLKEIIGDPDESLFLIGHSIGTIVIMRYLEQLPEGKQIGGVVLVAGYTDDLGYKELSNFFETPLDFPQIKSKSKKFVLIHSDDDPYVPIKYGYELSSKLGAELILKPGMKHFSGSVDNENSCLSLADVSDAIKRMSV